MAVEMENVNMSVHKGVEFLRGRREEDGYS